MKAAEKGSSRPTIGFISTWTVYQGTTMDRYAHSLIQLDSGFPIIFTTPEGLLPHLRPAWSSCAARTGMQADGSVVLEPNGVAVIEMEKG